MLIIVNEDAFLSMVKLVGGEDAARAVELLMKKPSLSDDELSQKLDMDVKELRKILHRLNDLGLVAYDVYREKDSGHRVFRWRVQQDQVIGFAKTQMRRVYERLKARLEHEQTHQIYWCGTEGCRKYTFEEAIDILFKCPKCGKTLVIVDNSKVIEALQRKIMELEKNLQ
ncbi:MAG: transcription factor [Aigarchaeota archaeon]|nr:transcription factor [Candidatus Pelearchaeum maunauluense]